MTPFEIDDVVHGVLAETREDDVGLWEVARANRAKHGVLDSIEVRLQGAAVCDALLKQGLTFGQFDGEGVFHPWPSEGACDRIVAEWSDLGRDPDIGEVGWFRA